MNSNFFLFFCWHVCISKWKLGNKNTPTSSFRLIDLNIVAIPNKTDSFLKIQNVCKYKNTYCFYKNRGSEDQFYLNLVKFCSVSALGSNSKIAFEIFSPWTLPHCVQWAFSSAGFVLGLMGMHTHTWTQNHTNVTEHVLQEDTEFSIPGTTRASEASTANAVQKN